MVNGTTHTANRLYTSIVRPAKVDLVGDALKQLEINGYTVTEVRGSGHERGHKAVYRGKEYFVSFLPRMQIDVVVPADIGDAVNKAIAETARTGEPGDGIIWQEDILGYTLIRTGEGFPFDLPNSKDGFYTIAAVVRPNKLDDIRKRLEELQLRGIAVTEVRGHGNQKGHTAVYRGKEYNVNLLPKYLIDIVVPANRVEEAYQAILTAGRTGEVGDGRIWLAQVDGITSIKTGKVLYVASNLDSKNRVYTTVISSDNLDDLRSELERIEHREMTATELRLGLKVPSVVYRGKEYRNLSIYQIEIAVPANIGDAVNEAIVKAARTGEKGDGVIWHRGIEGLTSIRELRAA